METKAKALGLAVDESKLASLYSYCRILGEYNEHTNMVAKADLESLINNHLLDCLSLVPYTDQTPYNKPKLVDIGSGAGLPGLILALWLPELRVTLVDSIAKKCRFLSKAVEELGLGDRVTIFCGRAEDLAHDDSHRERYALATARAVSNISIVLELTLPFLNKGGLLLGQRSAQQAVDEEPLVETTAEKLGGKFRSLELLNAEVLEKNLALLIVEKQSRTAVQYPRPLPQMKKKPL